MAHEILVEVRLLASRLTERQHAVARSCGQTRASWHLLAVAAAEGGTVPQLARRLEQTRQSVQRVADGLVERGLAKYVRNPHHRRSPLLQLSARGREALASLQREAERREPDLELDIEPEELDTTLYVLRALRETL